MNNKILTVTANPAVDRVYFVDSFNMGKVNRPLKISVSAGGKGINVARVSHLLGAEVIATGFLGGYTGDFIKSEIKKAGICDCFTRINDDTRICVNISDKNGVSGELLESGPIVTEKEKQDFIDSYKKLIEECSIIVISGSLPKGLTSEFYCNLSKIAQDSGKKLIVDTSGKLLEDVIKVAPYMIKPNKDEISNFFGSDKFETVKALKTLKELGIEVPFITLGSEGAVAMIEENYYKFSVPKIKVRNTVGSGDSSVGGIATGLSKGKSVIDSIKLGMAAGMSNTQFEATGIISKEQTLEYYEKITVSSI